MWLTKIVCAGGWGGVIFFKERSTKIYELYIFHFSITQDFKFVFRSLLLPKMIIAFADRREYLIN